MKVFAGLTMAKGTEARHYFDTFDVPEPASPEYMMGFLMDGIDPIVRGGTVLFFTYLPAEVTPAESPETYTHEQAADIAVRAVADELTSLRHKIELHFLGQDDPAVSWVQGEITRRIAGCQHV